MPKAYPPEFRTRVLALLRAGKTVQQVARELDLSDATTLARGSWTGSNDGFAWMAPEKLDGSERATDRSDGPATYRDQ